MVFSSPLFLFLFLPIVLGVYAVLPRSFWNAWLLLASLLFYAWGEKWFVAVMLASSLANYAFGLAVEKYRDKPAATWWVGGAVVANLGLLIGYKYTSFLVEAANRLLGTFHLAPWPVPSVHLPIGISFFTFHALSYVIDVYRRHATAQRSPVKIALYIALFPQLIAGPILRYHDVADQISLRRLDLTLFSDGVRRFIIGLAKKTLLANILAGPADQIFSSVPNHLTPPAAWLGIVCYSMQIYFDFSGYSDMAIGLGKMFGFVFPENFNYPYIAQSIREFWRRWHISLSTWFRDYLYIPLGGSRVSGTRNYLNLVTVFFLCGLWHGASWTFVAWGLYHGIFLVAERLLAERIKLKPWRPLAHGYALLVVMVGWVFFREDTFAHAIQYLGRMIGATSRGAATVTLTQFSTSEVRAALVAGFVACTPSMKEGLVWLHQRVAKANVAMQAILETVHVGGLATLFALCAFQLAAGTYNPFIYFRF